MKNDGGKGSSPRPFSVSHDEYSKRWDAIFQRDGLNSDKKDDDESIGSDSDNRNKTPSQVS